VWCGVCVWCGCVSVWGVCVCGVCVGCVCVGVVGVCECVWCMQAQYFTVTAFNVVNSVCVSKISSEVRFTINEGLISYFPIFTIIRTAL